MANVAMATRAACFLAISDRLMLFQGWFDARKNMAANSSRASDFNLILATAISISQSAS